MAKTNPTLRFFNRLIDRSDSVVYFVDDQLTIRFANDQAAAWIGEDVGEFKDRVLTYSAAQSVGEKNGKWSGLCPVPELLDSLSPNGKFFISRLTEAGREFCPAYGVRIDNTTQGSGVLVVADPAETSRELTTSQALSIPHELGQLHSQLTRLVSHSQSSVPVDALVGKSRHAARLRSQVKVAVTSHCDTLISGPFGCGKEQLARGIHAQLNLRVEVELAPVYCAIADAPLIQQRINDAQLSMKARGIEHLVLLLLDVDQLSQEGQSELMGFLEMPGLSISTLATSSLNPEQLGASETFAADLAYRLSPLAIDVPPLCQRLEDVPLIAQAVLEQGNTEGEPQFSSFSENAIERLVEYDWPENINELRRVVRAALSSSRGPVVSEVDLPEDFVHALSAQRIGVPQELSIELDEYMASIERALIERALKQAKGNKTKAARQLGVNRPRLLRRLQQLGLHQYLSPAPEKDSKQVDSSAFEELVDE